MLSVLIPLSYLTFFVAKVSGHSYFLISSYCSQVLAPGQVIMMSTALTDSISRSVIVTRNGLPLASGLPYIPGEKLQVTISSFAGEVAIETKTGKFVGGFCPLSNRVAYSLYPVPGQGPYFGIDPVSQTATLQIPTAGSGDVSVWAGFAYVHGFVSITPTFILTDPGVKVASYVPSKAPTRSLASVIPSNKPSTIAQISIKPTLNPSVKPTTAVVTVTGKPTTAAVTVTGKPTTAVVTFTGKPVVKSTTPTISPSTKLSFLYVGCYADTITSRAMPFGGQVFTSIQDCATFAKTNGYPYFGTQWYNGPSIGSFQGWFSKSLSSAIQFGISKNGCVLGSDAVNRMGGGNANAVYSV